MKNYTVKHTSKTTMISVTFKRGAMSETLQYELQGVLTETAVDSVYNDLSKSQKDSLNTNKNSFKQFIRAIKLKHPENKPTSEYRGVGVLMAEEKTFLASRLAPYLGITSNASANATIGYGTIDAVKYNRQIKANPNGIEVPDENLIYWENNGFVTAFKTRPIHQTPGGQDMYIYVTLLIS